MRIPLLDLVPGKLYAIKFQAYNVDGDTSDWSPVYRLKTIGDVTPPRPVDNLTWAATGSSFLATWTHSGLDGDGLTLHDLKDYEVVVSSGGKSRTFYVLSTSFELTLLENQQTFGTIATTVTISVRARDLTLNRSAAKTATAIEDSPPVPSTPTLTTSRGQITVHWNGQPKTGVRNDLNINHVEIHSSTTNNFTPTAATAVGRFEGVFPGPQAQILTTLEYDIVTYVKLVAVNRMGRKSDPSDQASATPQRLSGLDIGNGEISVDQINFADLLGGVSAFYENEPPEPPAFSPKTGDIWYDTNDAHRPYKRTAEGTWEYDPNINLISGTRIVAGTLTADAVGTNRLITAASNIGDAVIDSAHISSLTGDKITAGTLQSSSMVSYAGGTSRPAWSLSLTGDAVLNSANIRGILVVGNSQDTAAGQAASLVRSFDYIPNSAGWAIKGDGTVEFNNGTFRGQITGASIVGSLYQTATSGRRIEMGAAGSVGTMKFIAPDNRTGRLIGFTGNVFNSEAIRLEMPVLDDPLGRGVFVQAQDTDQLFIHAKTLLADYGRGAGAGEFRVRENTNATNSYNQEVYKTRMLVDPTNFIVYDSNSKIRLRSIDSEIYLGDSKAFRIRVLEDGGNRIYHDAKTFSPNSIGTIFQQWTNSERTTVMDRLWLDSDGTNRYLAAPNSGGHIFYENYIGNPLPRIILDGNNRSNYFIAPRTSGHYFQTRRDDGSVWFRMWVDQTNFVVNYENGSQMYIAPEYGPDASPALKMTTDHLHGSSLVHVSAPDGTFRRLEVRDVNMSIFDPVWAGSFVQQSSETVKGPIKELDFDATSVLDKIPVGKYQRKTVSPDKNGKRSAVQGPKLDPRIEIGTSAEQSPDQITIVGDDHTPMIDLSSTLFLAIASQQQANQKIRDLEQELEGIRQEMLRLNGGKK